MAIDDYFASIDKQSQPGFQGGGNADPTDYFGKLDGTAAQTASKTEPAAPELSLVERAKRFVQDVPYEAAGHLENFLGKYGSLRKKAEALNATEPPLIEPWEFMGSSKREIGNVVKPVPALSAAGGATAVAGTARLLGYEDFATELSDSVQTVQKQIQLENPVKQGSLDEATRGALTSLYTIAPGLLSGTGLTLLGSRAALPVIKAATLASMGAMSAGQTLESQLSNPTNPSDKSTAMQMAAINAAAEVIPEMFSWNILFGKGTDIGRRALQLYVSELLGENSTTAVNLAVDKLTINPEMSKEDAIQAFKDTTKQTLIATALLQAPNAAIGIYNQQTKDDLSKLHGVIASEGATQSEPLSPSAEAEAEQLALTALRDTHIDIPKPEENASDFELLKSSQPSEEAQQSIEEEDEVTIPDNVIEQAAFEALTNTAQNTPENASGLPISPINNEGDSQAIPPANTEPPANMSVNNASGESAASLEAQSRLKGQSGSRFFSVSRGGQVTELPATVDRVDAVEPKGGGIFEVKEGVVRRIAGELSLRPGQETVLLKKATPKDNGIRGAVPKVLEEPAAAPTKSVIPIDNVQETHGNSVASTEAGAFRLVLNEGPGATATAENVRNIEIDPDGYSVDDMISNIRSRVAVLKEKYPNATFTVVDSRDDSAPPQTVFTAKAIGNQNLSRIKKHFGATEDISPRLSRGNVSPAEKVARLVLKDKKTTAALAKTNPEMVNKLMKDAGRGGELVSEVRASAPAKPKIQQNVWYRGAKDGAIVTSRDKEKIERELGANALIEEGKMEGTEFVPNKPTVKEEGVLEKLVKKLPPVGLSVHNISDYRTSAQDKKAFEFELASRVGFPSVELAELLDPNATTQQNLNKGIEYVRQKYGKDAIANFITEINNPIPEVLGNIDGWITEEEFKKTGVIFRILNAENTIRGESYMSDLEALTGYIVTQDIGDLRKGERITNSNFGSLFNLHKSAQELLEQKIVTRPGLSIIKSKLPPIGLSTQTPEQLLAQAEAKARLAETMFKLVRKAGGKDLNKFASELGYTPEQVAMLKESLAHFLTENDEKKIAGQNRAKGVKQLGSVQKAHVLQQKLEMSNEDFEAFKLLVTGKPSMSSKAENPMTAKEKKAVVEKMQELYEERYKEKYNFKPQTEEQLELEMIEKRLVGHDDKDYTFLKVLEHGLRKALASGETWLKGTPTGQTLAKYLNRVLTESTIDTGGLLEELRPFSKYIHEHNDRLVKLITDAESAGTTWTALLDSVKGTDKEVLQAYRTIMNTIAQMSVNRDVKVLEKFIGKNGDIDMIEHPFPSDLEQVHFPHMLIDQSAELSATNRLAAVKNLMKPSRMNPEGRTAEQALKLLENILKSKHGMTRDPYLEYARQYDVEGYNTNLLEVTTIYTAKAIKRLYTIDYFGHDQRKIDSLLTKFENEGGDLAVGKYVVEGVLGTGVMNTDMKMRKLAHAMIGYEVVTKMGPFSALAQLGQFGFVYEESDLKTFARTMAKFLNGKTREEAVSFGYRSGAALGSIMKEFLDYVKGDTLVDRYLKTAGFTPLDRAARIFAAAAGREYVTDLFEYVKANPTKSGGAKKRLEQFGIHADRVIAENRNLSPEELTFAGLSMSEKTQYRSGAMTLPPWVTPTPMVRMITLFHQFNYHRLRTTINRFNENPSFAAKRIIPGLISAGLFGAANSELRRLVTGRERPDRWWKQLFEYIVMGGWFGMAMDAAQAAFRSSTGLAAYIAGPVMGELKVAFDASQALQGNPNALGKDVLNAATYPAAMLHPALGAASGVASRAVGGRLLTEHKGGNSRSRRERR